MNTDEYIKGYQDREAGKLCEDDATKPNKSKDYVRGYHVAHQRKLMLDDLAVMDRALGITK